MDGTKRMEGGALAILQASPEIGQKINAALILAADKPTHRHVKRGTEYILLGFGKMQAEKWLEVDPGPKVPWAPGKTTIAGRIEAELVDMREVAVYRSVDDGSLWVRPREEFEGRFVSIAA